MLIEAAQPEITTDRFNGGGLNGGAADKTGAYLASWSQTQYRIADVPIYAADALVRRAESLQLTADARAPVASLPSALWAELGLKAGEAVRLTMQGHQAEHVLLIAAVEDSSLAPGAARTES